MSVPCLLVRMPEGIFLSPQDSYEKLTISELKVLLNQGQEMQQSFAAELERRQISVHKSTAVTECSDKLQRTAENLQVLGRLSDKEAVLVASAKQVVQTEQTKRDSKIYRIFLDDITQLCGRSVALLCAASLGKQRIVSLNAQDRVQLVSYIKSNRHVFTFDTLTRVMESGQSTDETGKQIQICVVPAID